MSTLKERLALLAKTREKKFIPPKDRGWFWQTFKELKKSGMQYEKAWDFTCWALEHHYGLSP